VNAKLASVLVVAALALSGCASGAAGTTPNPAASSFLASAAARESSADAAAASAMASVASPSPPPCTKHACIVAILQQSLTGSSASGNSVATSVFCNKKTVKFHADADTYTATCTITYTDGTIVTGYGNYIVSAGKVTFQAES
jgi:uncharacterized protein YceK